MIERSTFDSDIYDLEIGWANAGDALLGLSSYDVVFLRGSYPCALHETARHLDVRYDLFFRALPMRGCKLRAATDSTFSTALAAEAFREHSRYHQDGRLRARSSEVYRRWVENAHRRGDLYEYTASAGTDAAGFVTVSRTVTKPAALRLDLIAVRPDLRKKGVGRAMIRELQALPGPEERYVTVEVGNLVAVHCYLEAGFNLARVESVQHLYPRERTGRKP